MGNLSRVRIIVLFQISVRKSVLIHQRSIRLLSSLLILLEITYWLCVILRHSLVYLLIFLLTKGMKTVCDAISVIDKKGEDDGLHYQNIKVDGKTEVIEMTANCLHVFCHMENDERETIEVLLREKYGQENARVFNTPAVDSLNKENTIVHPLVVLIVFYI